MKTVTIRNAKAKLSEWLRTAQDERVLITSRGAPVAILTGVEGRDMTELVVQYDERLQAALERAQRGPFTPIEKVRAELDEDLRRVSRRTPRAAKKRAKRSPAA